VALVGVDRRGVDAAARCADGGQRRAQVVRDRAEQGGLQRVAAAQRARLDGSLFQHAAATAGLQQCAECGHEPLNVLVMRLAGNQQRADALALCEKRDGAGLRVAVDPAVLEYDVFDPECLRDPVRGPLQSVGFGAEHDQRELGAEVRLAAAQLRLRGAGASGIRERAHDDRGDKVHAEADPVRGVLDREAAGRRDVEEVERRGARYGRQQPEPHTPNARDEQDREQVEDAGREHRHVRPDHEDDRRDGGDREGGDEQSKQLRRRTCAHGFVRRL
jgi:hypothetical protein